ncbi:hypothetical protein HPC49_48070 [Pyxidicoccus fallax]|uniref:SbsA Ig-like domain-containing protein n=1 Tax=Pyxidicoccus fallax TaxID=394095 RepID=A0A848LWA4_9BACT|nr:Ig-like domain-containing protein [Pyxidicoccus fallax]NMO21703.1 hypothetical protein [Pyxidicoccus fallax]NPC85929.1 hypothetical protein [Pyxidicoccus fallax]
MNLSKRAPLLALLGLLLSGCIDLPEVVDPMPLDDAGAETTHDAGTVPAQDGGLIDAGPDEEVHVSLSLVGEPTYVRSSVSLQVTIQGQAPDKVELLVDDELLATLLPPYNYTWDTLPYPEGRHVLVARATKNGRSVSSNMRELFLDRTPPRIVARAPSPGDVAAPAGQAIRVELSEPLAATTLNDASVQLRLDGSLVARTVELSVTGTVLTITPTAPGPLPHHFELALSNALTDAAGNPLDTTEASWSWHVPAWLSVGPSSGVSAANQVAVSPRLRLGSKTDPLLAWQTKTGIEVRRWRGNTWEALGGVLGHEANDVTIFASPPTLQVDANGTPHASWAETDDNSAASVFLKRWIDGGWRDVAQPTSGWGWNAPELQLDSGRLPWMAIVTVELGQGTSSIRLRKANGSQWNDVGPALRSTSAALASIRNLSMSLDGDMPVIAWTEFDRNGSDPRIEINGRIYVSRWAGSPSGWQSFGGAIRAHPSDTNADEVALALDGNGNPVIAWSESNPPSAESTAANVHLRRWRNSQWQALGSPLNATLGDTPATSPRLVLDSTGNPIVAWRESDGTTQRLHIRQWTGTSWTTLDGTPGVLPISEDIGAFHMDLDASGTPWVTFEAGPIGQRPRIHVYRLNR